MLNGKNYFAQYESPNIVLVPTLSCSNDNRSTSDSAQAIAQYNMPCCENSAAQATAGYPTAADATHFTNPSNLNYFDTVYNYNVLNHMNTTEENMNMNLLRPCSQFVSQENTVNNTLLNIQQPSFQDYSWANTNPARSSNNLIDDTMYASTSNTKINIKLKENNKNHTVTQETIDEFGLKNIVHTSIGAQNNEGILCNTDEENDSYENNKGTNLQIKEYIDKDFNKSNVITNVCLEDKITNLCKSTKMNNITKEQNNGTSSKRKINKENAENIAITKNNTSKEKRKVTDLKYLWNRHCARLKDKIKEEIEGSEVMKTQLHTQWKAILRSEYNTFVKKFYRSACISKNKMKSVITNNKLKLIKKPSSDFKNKQPIPSSSKSNTEFTQVNKDNRTERTHSLKSPIQAPKKAYLRKQYDNVDLRTILSRKQNQNISYEPPKRMPKRPRERENLIITVNQDIDTNTQKPAAMEPKPKKKCNKIKLVINVVCNESDSEEESDHNENDHCALLNEDLSFLDDFNVDDIVDSLNCDHLLNDTISTKIMITDNMSNNKATNKGLSEEMDTTEQGGLELEKENDVVTSPPAIINGNVPSVTGTSLNTHNSSEVHSITATTLISQHNTDLNLKSEKNDIEQICSTFSPEKIYSDERLPNENSDTENNTEVLTLGYKNDALILREINNIKNEFIAKIDHERNMDKMETEPAGQSIKNKTPIDGKLNGVNIKSENANMENDRDSKNNLDQRTTVTNTADIDYINTKTKSEYNTQTSKDMYGETQDLIEITTEDEPILISDDESKDESTTNIEVMEIEEVNNRNVVANEKINFLKENAEEVVIKATKKENALHTSGENAQTENKSLIKSLDEIVHVKKVIEMKDSTIKSHVLIKEPTVDKSKNMKITKEVKSTPDLAKPTVSDEKRVATVSNNINKFKDNCAKNKQINKVFKLGQEFVKKLEMRMQNFLGERYNITTLIKHGKFSKIIKCTHSNGEEYALKLLNSTADRHMLGSQKETMLMRLQKYVPREQLNIVYTFNSFGIRGYWCFIMEYYPKNLEQALLESKKGFHINSVQTLAKQLVAAVTVLSNNNVIHTDIKPKHVLLNSTNDKLKLCGFDESNYIQYLKVKPNTGTVNYRAPEVLLGFTADCRLDVWSTALVIFEMATGKKLFPGTYNNDILFKQMCTLGEIPRDMIEGSAYKHFHFVGNTFMRIMDCHHRKVSIPYFNKNHRLYSALFTSYRRDWQSYATKQEVFEDKHKLNRLHQLLEQMLTLDPRFRLPINFVGVSEFIQDNFYCC